MSAPESWPGGKADLSEVADEVEKAEAEAAEAYADGEDDDDGGDAAGPPSGERAGDADAGGADEDTGSGEAAIPGDEEIVVGAAALDDPSELLIAGHDEGELDIPDDVEALEGEARGTRRGVGVVVARSHVEVANLLLEAALAELDRAGVGREQVLVMAVPGAFELALGAMALAKTRRYACVVALGSATDSAVVAGEAASGLQLAALETGVPVAFGVLTQGEDDAEERGAAAVRSALEMADLFQQLRATAKGT